MVEHELQIGACGCEGDLRVALAATTRETHLPLLWRPVAVSRVPHLNQKYIPTIPSIQSIISIFALLVLYQMRRLSITRKMKLFSLKNKNEKEQAEIYLKLVSFK